MIAGGIFLNARFVEYAAEPVLGPYFGLNGGRCFGSTPTASAEGKWQG